MFGLASGNVTQIFTQQQSNAFHVLLTSAMYSEAPSGLDGVTAQTPDFRAWSAAGGSDAAQPLFCHVLLCDQTPNTFKQVRPVRRDVLALTWFDHCSSVRVWQWRMEDKFVKTEDWMEGAERETRQGGVGIHWLQTC